MKNEPSRSIAQRIFDIVIASLLGGILGAAIAWPRTHPNVLIVDSVRAKGIIVDGDQGTISIDGDVGISLRRHDYATALLWFHEPGTGSPGKGGPALYIQGAEPKAFKATPAGQETVQFDRDERDGL